MEIKHDSSVLHIREPYLDISCSLGEGPHWDEADRCLRFVDINKHEVHLVWPDRGPRSHRILSTLDIPVTHTADIEGDSKHFLFGGKSGFGLLDRQSGSYRYIQKFWDGDNEKEKKEAVMRANDGGIDSKGRYYLGVMSDPPLQTPGPEGTIFRLDSDLSTTKLIEGIAIPNGFTWSKDNKTMYLADSQTSNIYMYDFDETFGTVSNQQVFYHVEDQAGDLGDPDGQALDDDGNLWTAVWGHGKVVKLSPGGEVLATVKLPTRCVTCPVFVDDWLYITSAAESQPERYPESVRYGGALFRIQVEVHGRKINSFRMDGDVVV